MDRSRITLDNPAFAGRLRRDARGADTGNRPVYRRPQPVIQDMMLPTVQTTAPPPAVPIAEKSQATYKSAQPSKPVASATATPVSATPQLGRTVSPEAVISRALIRTLRQRTKNTQSKQTPKNPFKHLARRPRKRLPDRSDTRKQPWALYAMAMAIFVIGLTVSLNGLRTNRQVAAQVKQLSSKSDSSAADDNGATPSTTKPSGAAVSGYAVAPNLPRYIDIAKLDVHARVLSLGVTKNNQLKAPGNVYDAGWYNASAQPGQPGAMLVDGHISSWSTKGVFYGIGKLVTGDDITITRGDGQRFTYTVVKTQLFDANAVDMSSLLVSQNTAKPGLNLISCSGDVIPGTNEFDKRMVVYAVMQ